jgi:hypothetical protein
MNEPQMPEQNSPEVSLMQITTSEDIYTLRRSVENKGIELQELAFQAIKTAVLNNIGEGATKIAQELLTAATATNFLNSQRSKDMKDSIAIAATSKVADLLQVKGGAYNANNYVQSLRENLVPDYFDSATINELLAKISSAKKSTSL